MKLPLRLCAFIFVLPLLLTGCLRHTYRVQRGEPPPVVQAATLSELVERINSDSARIKTMNATVDIATAVGGAKKGRVTEYSEIRGYVLVRKPALLRMIGLFPVVGNRVFDMVSEGQQFRLSIPPKNKFIVGRNDVTQPSAPPLENMRPQYIFDALLLREIDPASEIAVMEAGSDIHADPKSKKPVQHPIYTVMVLRQREGNWFLSRKIVFSRADLQPHRQLVYDRLGNITTDAMYENFANFDGVPFPSLIEIRRPQEEYTIQLSVVKLKLNEALTDQQFALQQPAGSELVRLDQPAAAPANDSKQRTCCGGDGKPH